MQRPKTQDLRPEDRTSATIVPVTPPDSQDNSARQQHRHRVYASEATGLILIALVLLIATVIRYWRSIHWSLR